MGPGAAVLGVVQAGGKGSRMDVLTRERAKPALPFAGTHRLIDFVLSSMSHSGIADVWLSVQYQAGSLDPHVAGGRPWDLDRTRGGFRRLVPEEGAGSSVQTGFAHGNADDLLRVADQVAGSGAEVVVVSSADHVFALDLDDVVAGHLASEADCTLVTAETSRSDLLPRLIGRGRVRARPIGRYWRDVGRPEAYLAAHRDLLAGRVDALSDRRRPVMTRSPDRAPGVIRAGAQVTDSMVSVGCDVRGRVARAVLGPGVVVQAGAVVEDSVLFGDVVVEAGAEVRTAIVDDAVVVGRGASVGSATRSRRPRDRDIAIIGRDSRVGRNAVLPAGARLEPGTRA